jgi:hypothetical protein
MTAPMPKFATSRWGACGALFIVLAAAPACGAGQSGQTAAGNEVVETKTVIELPPPPEFVAPQPNPDGTHGALEMRRNSGKFMDQVVKIKGYVVFKYDCIQVLGPKVYKDSPDKCERPHFYIADEKDTSIDRSVWVVEVPRAPREDEKKVLPKEELNNPELWPPEPKYALGDQVEVEGTWSTKSPKGFVNSDGLLIFKGMEVKVAAVPAPDAPAPGAPAPEPAKPTKAKPGKKGK